MKLNLGSDGRTPPAGCWGDDSHPSPSSRFGDFNGDWSWKPARDKALGEDITLTGVPPSAAELYGRNSYSPA